VIQQPRASALVAAASGWFAFTKDDKSHRVVPWGLRVYPDGERLVGFCLDKNRIIPADELDGFDRYGFTKD
jgi:hypothetical protein